VPPSLGRVTYSHAQRPIFCLLAAPVMPAL
jgi:hypothetical protein